MSRDPSCEIIAPDHATQEPLSNSNMVSNTGGQKRQSGSWPGGEDHLDFGLKVDWKPIWPCLREQLVRSKELAADPVPDTAQANLIPLGNFTAVVSPTGRKYGRGGAGPYYAFELECSGLTLPIADTTYPLNGRCNVRVTAPGLACLQYGGLGCLKLARDIIRQAGGTIMGETLSRVDMRLDLPGVAIGPFWDAAREKRIVTRSKLHRSYESRSKSLQFSNRPLSLQVYDKHRQATSAQDPNMLDLVLNRCWNGTLPREATRIEFSIGRQVLTEKGIDTPDDYFRKRGDLVHYLCTKWIRFTESKVDPRNTGRARTLPLWSDVTAAFAAWAGQTSGEVLKPLPRGPVDINPFLKQGYGLLRRIAKELKRIPVPYVDYCDWILDHGLLPK